jgi:hypothetical protein
MNEPPKVAARSEGISENLDCGKAGLLSRLRLLLELYGARKIVDGLAAED